MKRSHLEAHDHLLAVSRNQFPKINEVLTINGPIRLSRRNPNDPFLFLARTIVGQQLSTKAATAIWSRIEDLAAHNNRSIEEICIDSMLPSLTTCFVFFLQETKLSIKIKSCIYTPISLILNSE